MMRRTILLTVLTVVVTLGMAQKKELSQARTYIKSGKDLDKAEKLMADLLKNPSNRENKKIYETWLDAVQGQYKAANEKLYLRQKYDTAAFYNLVKRMHVIAEVLDSVDILPDKNGKVKLEYRKDNAVMLDQLRPNLFFGGTYNVRKGQYVTAFDFFSTYIDAARQPLFTGYQYQEKDPQMPVAAYWATFCGYKLQDAERTLAYGELALKDRSKRRFVMQYMCEAYLTQKDEAAYVSMLGRGFDQFPEYPYFFPRLADYYAAKGQHATVLEMADKGLKLNQKNTLFLLAKSVALLNLNRNDECLTASKELIALNDTLPEAYYNIATVYLNQALELEKKNEPRKYRQQIMDFYAEARPYMENYRKLEPSDQQRWAPALYRVYLNLNMGKQFEEIDKLMRKN